MMKEREERWRKAEDAVVTEEGIPREELGEQFVQWLRAKRIIEKIG